MIEMIAECHNAAILPRIRHVQQVFPSHLLGGKAADRPLPPLLYSPFAATSILRRAANPLQEMAASLRRGKRNLSPIFPRRSHRLRNPHRQNLEVRFCHRTQSPPPQKWRLPPATVVSICRERGVGEADGYVTGIPLDPAFGRRGC